MKTFATFEMSKTTVLMFKTCLILFLTSFVRHKLHMQKCKKLFNVPLSHIWSIVQSHQSRYALTKMTKGAIMATLGCILTVRIGSRDHGSSFLTRAFQQISANFEKKVLN